MINLLGSFILFGSVCSNHPIMEQQCQQIHIKGLKSHVECVKTYHATLGAFEDRLKKKGLSMQYQDLQCIGGISGIDTKSRKV
jgi:hypothetical protein